ncbi:MAG: TlpA disulfide reductase family protein [Cyclobacteriaceae bacterium]
MRYLAIICMALLGFSTYAQQPTPEQIKMVADAKKEVKRMKGQKFPTFELTAMDGKTYRNEDLLGKIVLFNFWFTSCRPCVMELPNINAIVRDYKSDDIVFIAPTFEDQSKVDKFLTRFTLDYEVVPDVKEFVLGNNVRNFPTHFIIDQEGYIAKVITGYSVITEKSLRKSIDKLLK